MISNTQSTPRTNIMTIDVEEWFHANYHTGVFDDSGSYEERVYRNTETLLEMFSRNNVVATFFVLGYVSDRYPELIREISRRGHEIASHGCNHELVYTTTEQAFRDDITRSRDRLESLIGRAIKGYRAPSWSLTDRSTWAWRIMAKAGFKYSSSVFPIRTYLYGMPDAPRFAFQPKIDADIDLWEIPVSTVRLLGRNIPFSGGFYFRALPYGIVSRCVQVLNVQERQPAIVYLHPREIDRGQPRLHTLTKGERLIHYYGLNRCAPRFNRLLSQFSFVSIESYYGF